MPAGMGYGNTPADSDDGGTNLGPFLRRYCRLNHPGC